MTAALPTLVAAARDADPQVRAAAIKAIGELGEADGTEALVAALTDTSSVVRNASEEVLKNWRIGNAADLLEKTVASDDVDARRRAAIALVYQSFTMDNRLLSQVERGQQVVRPIGEKVQPVLKEAALDTSWPETLRQEAVIALGQVGDDATIKDLQQLLQAQNPLALPAAQSIALIGNRIAAAEAKAARQHVSEAAKLLLELVKTSSSPDLRLAAAVALANMRGIPVDELSSQLTTGDEETRAWAGAILAAIGKPASEKLIQLRGDTKTPMEQKVWAASVLQVIGDAMALQFMRHLPDSEKPQPDQTAAIRARLDDIRKVQNA
jgi:HEAT repeat protein